MDLSCKLMPRRWLTLSLLLLALGFIPAQEAAAQGDVEVRVGVNGDRVFMIFPQPLQSSQVPDISAFTVYIRGSIVGNSNTRAIRTVEISATNRRIVRLIMVDRLTSSMGRIAARYTQPAPGETRLLYSNDIEVPNTYCHGCSATNPSGILSSNRLGGLTFEPPEVLNFTLGVFGDHTLPEPGGDLGFDIRYTISGLP